MKLFLSILFGVVLTGATALAAMTAAPQSFTPDDMHWVAGTGVNKGLLLVTLVGNPNASGTAIIRVKEPDGYVNQPHYHSKPEFVTVISGTVLFGTGDKVDKTHATALPAGSFIMVPVGVHHWSVAKGETIVQVGGEGPLVNIPIKHGAM